MKLGYTILVLLFSNTLGSPVATEITSLLGTRSSAHEFISTDSSSLIHYEPKKFGDIAVIDRSSAIASTLVLVCITLCMTLVPSKCIDPGQLVNISSLPFIIPILWIFLIESVFSIATLTRLYQRHDVLSMFYEYSWPRFQTAFNSRCAVEVVVLLLSVARIIGFLLPLSYGDNWIHTVCSIKEGTLFNDGIAVFLVWLPSLMQAGLHIAKLLIPPCLFNES